MTNLLILLFVYLGWLLLWLVVCILAYLLCLILKSGKPYVLVRGIQQIATFILYLLLIFSAFYIAISLFKHHEWLWLVLFIFIGFSLAGFLYAIIIMPFISIMEFFQTKVVNYLEDADISFDYDIIDKDGKKTSVKSTPKLKRTAAILSIINYLVILASYIFSNEKNNLQIGDYIILPALWTGLAILVGLVVAGLFNLLRHKHLFPKGRLNTVLISLKVSLAITVLLGILLVFLNASGFMTGKSNTWSKKQVENLKSYCISTVASDFSKSGYSDYINSYCGCITKNATNLYTYEEFSSIDESKVTDLANTCLKDIPVKQ